MQLTLNRFCRFRFGSPIECDLLLEARSIRLHHAGVATVILGLTSPASVEDVRELLVAVLADRTDVDELLAQIIASQLLVPVGYEHPLAPQAAEWVSHGWTEALALHRVCDNQQYTDIGPRPLNDRNIRIEERRPPEVPRLVWRSPAGEYSPLPDPAPWPEREFTDVLLARRSHIPWSGCDVDATVLSRILVACNAPLVAGRRDVEGNPSDPNAHFRNMYADFETYVAVHSVAGVKPGLYHYEPGTHSLGLMRHGDLRRELAETFVGQRRAGEGAFALVLSANWESHMARYPNNQRGYRTIMILAGRLAHRYLIACTTFGLVTFPTPAHNPSMADDLLGTPRLEESALYLISAG